MELFFYVRKIKEDQGSASKEKVIYRKAGDTWF